MEETLHRRINDHLALEFGAAHRYLALAIWFELHDLPGFARFMRQQSQDELGHAGRFVDHLLERDLGVELPAIDKPPAEWQSVESAVSDVLEAEREVTRSIEDLYDLAEKASDRPAMIMLQWFINEQVEEENVARALLGRIRLVDGNGLGLLMIDQELGKDQLPGAMEEAGNGVAT